MQTLSKNRRLTSVFLKLLVIFSAGIGTYLSATAGKNSFMGGIFVFKYFTIQSNIGLALICILGLLLMTRKQPAGKGWYVLQFVGTVSITLTGMVFCFVLAPTMGDKAWNVQNVLTHVVVPVASVADFFVSAVGSDIRKKQVFYVTLPPLAYAVYAAVGYVLGWEFSKGVRYPYFFLNWGSPAGAFGFTDTLPFMGCVWWILLLLAFLIGVGLLYLKILNRLKKQ